MSDIQIPVEDLAKTAHRNAEVNELITAPGIDDVSLHNNLTSLPFSELENNIDKGEYVGNNTAVIEGYIEVDGEDFYFEITYKFDGTGHGSVEYSRV